MLFFRIVKGIDLISANLELAGMELTLVNATSRETVLRGVLSEYKRHYDYIIIDCSPFIGMMTKMARQWNSYDFARRFFSRTA